MNASTTTQAAAAESGQAIEHATGRRPGAWNESANASRQQTTATTPSHPCRKKRTQCCLRRTTTTFAKRRLRDDCTQGTSTRDGDQPIFPNSSIPWNRRCGSSCPGRIHAAPRVDRATITSLAASVTLHRCPCHFDICESRSARYSSADRQQPLLAETRFGRCAIAPVKFRPMVLPVSPIC